MTILVTVSKVSKVDEWYYWYDEMYNMVSVTRIPSQLPRTTLQGAYCLIIKADTAKILSYFETVTVAEITYWKVVPSLTVPISDIGHVLVAQDIDDGQPQAYFTDPNYGVFYTQLGEAIEPTHLRHIAIGPQVIVDIAENGMLAGVWMLELPPEIGQKHAAQRITSDKIAPN